MNLKSLFLFIAFSIIYNSQAGKLNQEQEKLLLEKYSKIGQVLESFYLQPLDNATLTKEKVKLIYENFISKLTKEELELVKNWNNRKIIPQPKWLIED